MEFYWRPMSYFMRIFNGFFLGIIEFFSKNVAIGKAYSSTGS